MLQCVLTIKKKYFYFFIKLVKVKPVMEFPLASVTTTITGGSVVGTVTNTFSVTGLPLESK